MNEFDSTMITMLDRISPQPSRDPDWLDVLDRAGVKRGGRSAQSRRRWSLTVAAAMAAGAAALALAWPFAGSPDVISQALAAIGNGRLTHAVLETSLGSSLVNLDTGKRTPVHEQTNIWYDPQLGLVETTSFQGSLLSTFRFSPHSTQLGSSNDAMLGLISGYRAALKSGSYHLVGKGTLEGKPVYWIETKPSYFAAGFGQSGPIETFVQQVAISRSTYKPLYMRSLLDGRVQQGMSTRVVSVETGPPNPALFSNARTRFTGYGYTPSSPSTTIPQAAAAMGKQPLTPPARLDRLPRSWTGQPRYTTGKALQSAAQFPAGIEFFYGKLDDAGDPVYAGPNFISITEYAGKNAVVRGMGLVRFPDNAQALLQDNGATLRTHGFYVIIDAATPTAAIAAARALGR